MPRTPVGETRAAVREFVCQRILQGDPPSVREIQDEFGFRSTATARGHLNALVEAGAFRQDLYYRLNVIELNVPPLRERRDDVELLIDHFLGQKAAEFGVPTPGLGRVARDALVAYDFPGNVRELENILERALTLCENDEIHAADLRLNGAAAETAAPPSATVGSPPAAPAPPGAANPTAPPAGGAELQAYLDDVERQRIIEALERTRWNKTQAAKLLGISFRALRYRIKKLGIE